MYIRVIHTLMRTIFGFALLQFLCFSAYTQTQDIDDTPREKDALHSPATANLSEFNTVDNPHMGADEIKDLATRNAYEMAMIMSSQVEWYGGNDLFIRSAPAQIYVDGVKIRGSISLPKKAIAEVRIISGGGGQ